MDTTQRHKTTTPTRLYHQMEANHHSLQRKEEVIEYASGAGASLINIILTFPVNKVMFRQQVEGIRMTKALRHIYREGTVHIFRGVLPPLMQRTISVSVMFGSYSNYYHIIQRHYPTVSKTMPFVHHSLAAFSAGCTEAVFMPLERVQMLLQDRRYHGRLNNTFHTVRTVASLGPREFYRGLSAIVIRNGLSNILFLGLREPLQDSLHSRCGELLSAFVSGAGLGAALSTIFFPLNVVKSRMQTKLGGPFHGIWETFLVIYNERGHRWRKMYRGVHINYTRSFLSWGIINTLYSLFKKSLSEL